MKQTTEETQFSLLAGEVSFDPIEDRLRATIEAVFEEELADFRGRLRYRRGGARRDRAVRQVPRRSGASGRRLVLSARFKNLLHALEIPEHLPTEIVQKLPFDHMRLHLDAS